MTASNIVPSASTIVSGRPQRCAKTQPSALRTLSPRLASREDLEKLRRMLERERDADPRQEGFFNNWNIIEKHFHKSRLTVLHEEGRKNPVAFAALLKQEIDMFWVKPDRRRAGIGRRFSDMICWAAESQGTPGLLLQRVRKEAIPFWIKMGYKNVQPNQNWGYAGVVMTRTFPHKVKFDQDEKGDGSQCEVTISLARDELDTGLYQPYGDVGKARGYYFCPRLGQEYICLERGCVLLINGLGHIAISINSTIEGESETHFDKLDLKMFCTGQKLANQAFKPGDHFIAFTAIDLSHVVTDTRKPGLGDELA